MTNHINKISKLVLFLLLSQFLISCTEGDRGFIPVTEEPAEEQTPNIIITGGAVKGPLINSDIAIYKLELDQGSIYSFNKAMSTWFNLLESNQVEIIDDQPVLGGISAEEVTSNIQRATYQYGYVSELKYLKAVIKEAISFSNATQLIEDYLNEELLNSNETNYNDVFESNTAVRKEVEAVLTKSSTLGDIKRGIDSLETLTEKILKVESFAEARSLLSTYKSTETDDKSGFKLAGFTSVIASLDSLNSQSSQFNLSSIKSFYNTNIYEAFLNDFTLENDPQARQNILSTKEKLDVSSTVTEAKTLIEESLRKEGHALVRAKLAELLSKIITFDDFLDIVKGHESFYHDFSIRSLIPDLRPSDIPASATNLDDLYLAVSENFKSNLEAAFRESLIINEDDSDVPTNRLSFGVSNDKGLLPNLFLGDYRGFVYMEAISSEQTIDLNSGSRPMFERMETIFHTDDILGNGDNSSVDETVYFLLNGELQIDDDGNVITDRSLITTLTDDKLLEIRPSFFASPLTSFAFGLSIEKLKNFSLLHSDADSDLLPENEITESLLKNTLQSSALITKDTFGIGLSEPNLFKASPVRLAQMQYSLASEQQAVQYRMSIENYASFLYDLVNLTNLKLEELVGSLIKDIGDGQIDGYVQDEPISNFINIPQLEYLVGINPSERLIPDTAIPVSNVYYLMNSQHDYVLPEESISFFKMKNSDLVIKSPLGGTDQDSDGVLDHDDQFPEDPTRSRDLQAGYAGLWSVSYDNSETEYMPFKVPFSFQFNVDEVEGMCSNSPCVGIGNSATLIQDTFEVISAPKNHDLVIEEQNDESTLGFTAFATVPGDYLVKAVLSANTNPQLPVTDQKFTVYIPIHVVDPKSIEIIFEPAEPQPGKAVSVLFKATKALCHLYPICTEININDDQDDFLPLSLLADIFSINQKVIRDGSVLAYSSIRSQNPGQTGANLSNLELNDLVSVSVNFNAGDRNLTAASYNNIVGDGQDSDGDGISDINDFYPMSNLCHLEKDGIQDTNYDGVINSLDTPYCFASILDKAETPLTVSFLNEVWYYVPEKHFIVRGKQFQSTFNGYIKIPTDQGARAKIALFREDAVTKRMYLAYKNGAIDYFSFEQQTIQNFTSAEAFQTVKSMHLLGTYLLVEYSSSTNELAAKLFNHKAELANIQTDVLYPFPNNAVSLKIDNQDLVSATNNQFKIDWVLEREDENQNVQNIPVQITNDGQTLSSGQTVFGDVVKVSFSYEYVDLETNDINTIKLEKNVFVLGISSLAFTQRNFEADQPLSLDLVGFNSDLLIGDESRLSVKWYKNNINTDGEIYLLSDTKYPFVLEESNFELGDMISGDIFIKQGNKKLLIASLDAVILGDLPAFVPSLDSNTDQIFNGATRTVNLTVAKPTLNDKYFSEATFTPNWKINGARVENENQLNFPSLASTSFKYEDVISVSYDFQINGVTGETADFIVGILEFDNTSSVFSISPEVAELGQDLSLNLEDFSEDTLAALSARWRVNGGIAKKDGTFEFTPDEDEDESDEEKINKYVTDLTFPASRLSYGDAVELLLLPMGTQIESAFSYIAKASVGVNLESLSNNQVDPVNDLDTDNDGVPNHSDYFRNDAQCSLASEGVPDDIDFDGISDLDELKGSFKTNPNLIDTDKDGLSDDDEINVHSTNPLVADTDGDGYLDGIEIDLGFDPNILNSSVNDNDFDGLSNVLELKKKTKVNVADTDGDGLTDWYEIEVSKTDPLNPDTDNDKLSDGAEVRKTDTNPTKADSDDDGILDGIEVVLKLNPNSKDTDDDGTEDAQEEGYDFNVNIPAVLNQHDLLNYKNNFSTLISVEQGVCFKTWLANNKPSKIKSTNIDQSDADKYQEIAFTSDKWDQVIRYDAKNQLFTDMIDVSDYNAYISSIVYDINLENIIYLGFSDGWVRKYNSLTQEIEDLFNTGKDLPVETMVNTIINAIPTDDVVLITEQVENNQVIHSAFNSATGTDPISVTFSDFSYRNSIWLDDNRLQLLSFDANYSETTFIKQTVDPSLNDPIVSSELIATNETLESPLYIENINGINTLIFGNGVSFNLSTSALISATFTPFSQAFKHQNHRILAQRKSSILDIMTTDKLNEDKYWQFNTQLTHTKLLAVIPVGFDLLAISSEPPTNQVLQDGKISFQNIVLGDKDGDSLPDWFNNLSSSLTGSDYNDLQLSDDAIIPDFLDGTPNVDDSLTPPLLVDSDGDNICDQWEISLFNTDPSQKDTDGDKRDDNLEIGLVFDSTKPLDCTVFPEFAFVSDPLNPDTDGDGLSDFDEVEIHSTNPLIVDTDGDGISDFQEFTITNTKPLESTSSTANGPDNELDSDSDGLKDWEELNVYHTNHLSADSDSDQLNDFDEAITYGTNPNSDDSDGDTLTDYVEIFTHGTDPNSIDTDTDGVSDVDELTPNPFTSNPIIVDTDGDGLTDLEEFNFSFEYADELRLQIETDLNRELNLVSDPNSLDTDGDGICDKWEVNLFFSNPAEVDTDGDRLTDAEELGITVDANEPIDCTTKPQTLPISLHMSRDTDSDRILDGDEVLILLTSPTDKDSNDNTVNDDLEDPDQDGLNNYQELYQTLTNPLIADSDNDGIIDSEDDEDGDGLSNIDELTLYETDPREIDSDFDGIDDGQEIADNLNPKLPDSDDDGLTDIEERDVYKTDPSNKDTDADGLVDGDEINAYKTDPKNPDTDHDFLRDGDDDFPLNHDQDGDGIPDGIEELYLKTDPGAVDTDGDGKSDGYEAWVFAFTVDSENNETNTLLATGTTLDIPFNSKVNVTKWPAPTKFDDNNLDRISFVLVDVLDPSIVRGKLYVQRYSNPASNDSDGDGLFDSTEFEIERVYGLEYHETLDPAGSGIEPLQTNSVNFKISNPWDKDTNAALDSDNDGLPDFYELNYTLTDPNNADTDDNGITDQLENPDLDLLNNLQEIMYGSNPNVFDVYPDTDGDGLLDVYETLLFSNLDINSADSDSDGIPDGLEDDDQDLLSNLEEILLKTDPLTKNFGIDSDSDGLSDYQEIFITFTDPNGSTDDGNADPDNDSISNIDEMLLGGNPNVFDDRNNILDSDNDGLSDFQEINLTKTDPFLSDTDGNGVSDAFEDIDFDNLTHFQELKLGTNPLVADSSQLRTDTDNDGLVDIYEVKITNTDPTVKDTDADGNFDGQADTDDDGLSEFVEILLGLDPAIRNKAVDSDNDGLTDAQEVLITLTDPNLVDSDINSINDADEDFDQDGIVNSEEIRLLTDPYLRNVSDGNEDIDKDFYNNLLEQQKGIETVTNSDTDNDGILDGIEALLLSSDIFLADTDGDGISDNEEVKSRSFREIDPDQLCSEDEIRLFFVGGKDYCFTIEYFSYPTLSDSDNDGVADRSVNEADNSVILDHFPLDPSCNLSTDGFTKDDLTIQCFSSWMSEAETLEFIKYAQWDDTSGTDTISHADVLFYNSTWDSIVVYNALTETYGARISIKDEINSVDVSLVDFEFSKADKLIYMLYSDSTIETYNVLTGALQTLVDSAATGTPETIKLLDTGKLVLKTKTLTNQFNLYLLDISGSNLDELLDTSLDIHNSLLVCADKNTNCNGNVNLLGFIKDASGSILNLGSLEIDLIANTFNAITESPFLNNVTGLSGPIRLSLDAASVQLGSGQIVDLSLKDTESNLTLEHAGKTYETYFDFHEYADHFIGVVDVDLSNIPGGSEANNVQNGMLVTELDSIKETLKDKLSVDDSINDLKELNQYFLPPEKLEEKILKLIPFEKTPAYEMAIVKKRKDRIVIEPLGLFDEDDDLITGIYERFYGLDDLSASDKFLDLDSDGLANVEEYFFATDPSNEDSDGDGWYDITEILNGTNPNSNLSF